MKVPGLEYILDLVPLVQFEKREKHPRRSAAFSKPAILPTVTLLRGCFTRFLNCANGTKLHKASHIEITHQFLRQEYIHYMQKSTCIA